MKRHLLRLFWLCLSLGLFFVPARVLFAQIYNPNLFDINITFGCNCTCFCDTNNLDTNNPVSAFLNANPVAYIASTAVMPPAGQTVPPHWTELLKNCSPPLYGDAAGDDYAYPAVGWTVTRSSAASLGYYGYTPFLPVTFNLNYPLQFNLLDYWFYADALPSDLVSLPPGRDPVQSQTQCQPYPWDVNLTLQLQNGQLYYMEQQLVVGYDPEFNNQALLTPVDYVETNSLLTISLYCTNGGVTNILQVSGATLTATLLPDNIPAPLDQNNGWVFTPDFYTNWAWPLTPNDMVDPNGPPGSAGTVQASLNLGSGTIDHQNLLVRANRAYQLALTYYLSGYYIETLYVTNTGVMPPCTNVLVSFYTDICTNPFVMIPPNTNEICFSTNVGLVDIMGAPVDPPGITLWAAGDNNTFTTTLTGSALAGLPGTPVPFSLPVFLVNVTSADFEKWATESLGSNTDYEYFRSPSVYPVTEHCSATIDMTNDFVMCPTNPAIVQGNITLNGCVNSNYYGGVGALNYLQFATYNNGLPFDPSGLADPMLQNVSSIQATNGASAFSPFDTGHGFAITEFDNPGGFIGPNSYIGHYSLKLAGLQSLPSSWGVNDLHLVFGSPVNLDYHIVETNSAFTNVNISCGEVVSNDIALCFGLVTIPVINAHPQPIPANLIYTTVNINVSGSGPGYTVSPLDFNNFTFQYQSPTHNEADIPLFLPQGSYQYITTVVTAGGSHLVLGTNYFTVTCCTNSCLQVYCSTNKTVSCADTNWSFDPPLIIPGCCGSNYSVNVFGIDVTTNVGNCSMTSTRTWQITDCYGQVSYCSQTVTIAPPDSYSITLPAGTRALIANQLDNGSGNHISALLATLPDDSTVSKWNCSGFIVSTKSFGVWTTDFTLAPGEGAFVTSPATVTLTFTGTPVCPPLVPSLCPCGTQSLLSYGLDCLGTFQDITGLEPQEGAEVLRWNGSGYTAYSFTGGAWSPAIPVLNIGEAAFFMIPCPAPPVLHTISYDGITKGIVFTLGPGSGTFTFNNNGWSVSDGSNSYVLQYTTNLASPNWMTVCNAIPTIGYTFTNQLPVSFYRLHLQNNN